MPHGHCRINCINVLRPSIRAGYSKKIAGQIGKQNLRKLEIRKVYEGKVLDGRHRHYACQETGVEARYREYSGSDPLGFVVSLNLKRRHLTESQRAMIAASMANMRQGERTDVEPCLNLSKVSQSDAANMLQVSRTAVQTAAKIERESTPEVIEAVKSGAMSLNLASQELKPPCE